MSVQHGLLVGHYHCGMLQCCVTALGMTSVDSGDHGVSGSLLGVIRAPLHVLVALLCSMYGVFHVACLF